MSNILKSILDQLAENDTISKHEEIKKIQEQVMKADLDSFERNASSSHSRQKSLIDELTAIAKGPPPQLFKEEPEEKTSIETKTRQELISLVKSLVGIIDDNATEPFKVDTAMGKETRERCNFCKTEVVYLQNEMDITVVRNHTEDCPIVFVRKLQAKERLLSKAEVKTTELL